MHSISLFSHRMSTLSTVYTLPSNPTLCMTEKLRHKITLFSPSPTTIIANIASNNHFFVCFSLLCFSKMPIQANLQWTDFLLCPICQHDFTLQRSPISLGCGHTICKLCLATLHRKQCPFDQVSHFVEHFFRVRTLSNVSFRFVDRNHH